MDEQCPVCGYYCLGKGGHGCIDKTNAKAEEEIRHWKTLWGGNTTERDCLAKRLDAKSRRIVVNILEDRDNLHGEVKQLLEENKKIKHLCKSRPNLHHNKWPSSKFMKWVEDIDAISREE